MSSRRQYTSCDSCRKSRLGCDAASKNGGSCSNCIRRNKQCTVAWTQGKNHRQPKRSSSTEQQPPRPNFFRPAEYESQLQGVPPTTVDTQKSETQVNFNSLPDYQRQQALALHNILWDIFTDNFEPQLGLWIGNDCNPFQRVVTPPKTLVSRLMVTLDYSPRGVVDKNAVRVLGMSFHVPENNEEDDPIINQALISAVHCFSARWLPLEHFMKASNSRQDALKRKEEIVQSTWRIAHRDVLKVCTKPSYRALLALYLFGITPTSPNNKERKISACCYETFLRHLTRLMTVSHIFPYSRNTANSEGTWSGEYREPADEAAKDMLEFRHLEETAYWLGIVCDTSRSIIQCQPSILLPGLSGDAKVWNLVRKKIKDFDNLYRPTHSSKVFLTDERVLTILQFGSAHKTLCWAMITRVQDALFYQNTGLTVQQALEVAVREIDWFEDVFGPLLDQCGRDYLLLSESSRISYFLLSLHFHLGVLILLDTLDCVQALAFQPVMSFNSLNYRLTSTRALVNLMNLVLQTDEQLHDPTRASILLKDPYPEHVSNGLTRTANSLLQLYKSQILPATTVEMMSSAIFTGLDILTQISYSATDAFAELQVLYEEAKLKIKSRQKIPTTYSIPSPVAPESFQAEIVQGLENQALADPGLVRKSIERHEKVEYVPMFIPDDFQWGGVMGQDFNWAFDDCFISF